MLEFTSSWSSDPRITSGLRVLRTVLGFLLIAYLAATSLVSWSDDPRSIERWPLPVLGTGPFRDLSSSTGSEVDSGFVVDATGKRIALRLDLWSINSMSNQDIFTISTGKEILNIKQEYGSLFAYVNSPDYSHRELLLPNIASGKNQLLFILDALETAYLSYNDSTASGIIPFKQSKALYFTFVPSTSSQLNGDYGSIHLRVGILPNSFNSTTLFERFVSSNHFKRILFNTFLLFFGIFALRKLVSTTLGTRQRRKSRMKGAAG
jgi:hypothetical protein